MNKEKYYRKKTIKYPSHSMNDKIGMMPKSLRKCLHWGARATMYIKSLKLKPSVGLLGL